MDQSPQEAAYLQNAMLRNCSVQQDNPDLHAAAQTSLDDDAMTLSTSLRDETEAEIWLAALGFWLH